MLDQRWASIADAGPTLSRHRVSTSVENVRLAVCIIGECRFSSIRDALTRRRFDAGPEYTTPAQRITGIGAVPTAAIAIRISRSYSAKTAEDKWPQKNQLS